MRGCAGEQRESWGWSRKGRGVQERECAADEGRGSLGGREGKGREGKGRGGEGR